MHPVVNFIIIDLALRTLGHVALLKCNLWTASVTDPLLHAIASRLFKFSSGSGIYEISIRSIQFNLHEIKKKPLSSMCCWNCRGEREEIKQVKNSCCAYEEPFFSIEAACSSWESNSVHERMVVRLMHRCKTGWLHCSHSSRENNSIISNAPCLRPRPLSVSCFSIYPTQCTVHLSPGIPLEAPLACALSIDHLQLHIFPLTSGYVHVAVAMLVYTNVLRWLRESIFSQRCAQMQVAISTKFAYLQHIHM